MKTKTEKKAAVGKGLVGKTSGLNKRAFYIATLKENEKAKRNDVELQKAWDAEFPDTVHYQVAAMRSKLNRGGFGEVGFQSKAYGTPAKAKKEVPTIVIPDTAPELPANKVRLRRGKES